MEFGSAAGPTPWAPRLPDPAGAWCGAVRVQAADTRGYCLLLFFLKTSKYAFYWIQSILFWS